MIAKTDAPSAETLDLTIQLHPFRPHVRNRSAVEIVPGLSLLEIRERYFPGHLSAVAYVNGELVPESKWGTTFPWRGDRVVFCAMLEGGGGGGKGILRSILMLAVVVAATFLAPSVFAKMAVLVIGGLLINALLPPDNPQAKDSSLDSQAYSWSSQNTQQQGVPVARWYGRHKVYGNIIASYLESIDDDQYMNCLICAGLGPVSAITDFEINEQPASSFEDVAIKVRQGHLDQDVIRDDDGNAFVATKTEYQVGQKVSYGTPRTYVTVGDEFDIIEVELTFPNGVWRVDTSDGDLVKYRIRYQVEVKRTSSETWIPIARRAADDPTYSHVKTGRWSLGKMVSIEGVDYWWDRVMGGTVKSAHVEGDTHNQVLGFSGGWIQDMGTGISTGDFFYGLSSSSTALAYVVELLSGAWDQNTAAGVITLSEASGAFENEIIVASIADGDSYAYVGPDVTHAGCSWRWIENMTVLKTESVDADDFDEVYLKKTSAVRKTYKYVVPEGEQGNYDVRVTRLTESPDPDDAGNYGDDLYFTSVREVFTDVFEYPRHVLVAVKAKATDQLSGSISLAYLLEGAIVRIPGTAADGAGTVATTGSSTEVVTTGDAFAGVAVGDDLRAGTDQVTVVAKSETDPDNAVTVHRVVDWTGGKAFAHIPMTYAWSDNPAWVALDVATQPVLAGTGTEADPYRAVRFDGIDPARIDLVKFREWADWCDEQLPDDPYDATSYAARSTFNGGFDYDTSLWEALLRVCQVGRAVPVWMGMDLTLAIDKEADPVNLYTMGNIEVDEKSGQSSFKETFLSQEDRATVVEIDYTDAAENYERTKMTVYRPDVMGDQFRASLDLFGVTNAAEAWRAGMYRLLCNRYLVRTIVFEVDIEALNAMIGDVIIVQHDVPRWGDSGRIVSATSGTVTLDKEVTIEAGLTYKVIVRLSDDTLQERTVTTSAGSVSTLAVTPSFNPVPAKYDVYAFGLSATVSRKFRITQIDKTQDQKVKLTCVEYRPEVYAYDNELPGIPEKDTSTLDALKALQPTQVALEQASSAGAAGRTNYGFTATWTNVVDSDLARVEVWITDKASPTYDDWTYGGSTSGETLDIFGLTAGMKYWVVLLPVDTAGNRLHVRYARKRYGITIQSSTRAADLFFDDGTSVADHRTTVDGQVATLDGQVTTLDGQVSTLDGQVATVESAVATLQSGAQASTHVHMQSDESGDLMPALADLFELTGQDLTLSATGTFDPDFELDANDDVMPRPARPALEFDANDDVMTE